VGAALSPSGVAPFFLIVFFKEEGVETFFNKFKSKVELKTDTDCWEWNAGKNVHGYGLVRFNKKTSLAHRVSYKIFNGDIPKNMKVLHICDNPVCVNPEHLRLGSHVENMIDMARKGRQGSQVLQLEDVVAIKKFLKRRNRSKTGRMEYGASRFLCRWFNVSRETITQIISGRNWSHVN